MAVILNARGTSVSQFQLGKQGPLIKNNGGTIEFRNVTDTAYTEIKAGGGATPTSDESLTTKAYVDNLLTGLDVKNSVRVATLTSSDIDTDYTYNNANDDNSTATPLIWTRTGAGANFDGVTLVDDDRVLIKDASDPRGNGIFTFVADTGGGDSGFRRADDTDNTPGNEVSSGMFTFIEEGTQTNTGWVLSSISGNAILGTDSLSFTQFSGGAGGGISEIVEDATPQLGGDLDVNGNSIISVVDGDIPITPNGNGNIILDGLSWPGNDGSALQFLQTDGSGNLNFATALINVVEDTSPQLGGDLDVNGNSIISISNGDIAIVPDGTGQVIVGTPGAASIVADDNSNVTISGGASDGTDDAGDTIVSSGDGTTSFASGDIFLTPGTGGSMDGSVIIDGLIWPSIDGTNGQALTTDGSGNLSFSTVSSMFNLVDDTTPQLGGDLDVNGQSIVSVSDGDITIAPDGSGLVKITDSDLDLSNGSFLRGEINAGGTWHDIIGIGTGDDTIIRTVDQIYLQDENGKTYLRCNAGTADAVNYFTIGNAAADNGPVLSVGGADTDIDLTLESKGSGVIDLNDNTEVTGTLSTTDAITSGNTINIPNGTFIRGRNNADDAYVSMLALSTGDDLLLRAAGASGRVVVQDENNNETLIIQAGAADAVGYISINNAATGTGPLIQALGETDTHLRLATTGAGQIKLLDDTVFSGDITINGDIVGANTDFYYDNAGTGSGPHIYLKRHSDTPANNDNLGEVRFHGTNDNDQDVFYGGIRGDIVDVTDGAEYGEVHIRTMVGGSTGIISTWAQGMYMSGATGGDKGAGTINATAVYDDNTLLTCYVIEAANTGTIDQSFWDSTVPDKIIPAVEDNEGNIIEEETEEIRTHERAAAFATRITQDLDPDQFAAFWKANGHLPAFPDPDEWMESQRWATGDVLQRLWETVEVLAVHIDKLNQRIKTLEGE